MNGTAYFGLTYVSIHLIRQLGCPKTPVYGVTTAVVLITALLMLPVGRLGDRVDLPTLGAIGMAPTAPAFFVMLAAAVGLVAVWAIARGPRPGCTGD